jgi:ankyrin repeat protein
LLLQAGANPRRAADVGVFLGKTPLMWASSQGRTEVVRLLLLAGVDVNHSSHLGNFKVISFDVSFFMNLLKNIDQIKDYRDAFFFIILIFTWVT